MQYRSLKMNLVFRFLKKNGRNTTLTRFGDEFLACTKQTISTLDGGVNSIQREARGDGVIRGGFLRAFGTQFVPQLASQFLKENKDNEIDFTFHSGATRKLINELEQKKYDLVFCSKLPAEYRFTSVAVEFVLDKYKKHEN